MRNSFVVNVLTIIVLCFGCEHYSSQEVSIELEPPCVSILKTKYSQTEHPPLSEEELKSKVIYRIDDIKDEEYDPDTIYRLEVRTHISSISRSELEVIYKFRNLQELEIRARFNELPDCFCFLKNLETLSLVYKFNTVSESKKEEEKKKVVKSRRELSLDAIKDLKYLRKLRLDYVRLKGDLTGIAQLQHLEELNIQRAKLTKLSEELGSLKKLKELNLSYNLIGELPENLGDLENLRSLNIQRNRVSKFPESISNLKKLRSLEASKNRIQKLPKEIGKLSQLRSLSMDNNRIRELPESITQLKKLDYMDFSFNRIQKLPSNIGDLDTIRAIRFSSNLLQSLPKSLKQLEYHRLDMNNNLFTKEQEQELEEILPNSWFQSYRLSKGVDN